MRRRGRSTLCTWWWWWWWSLYDQQLLITLIVIMGVASGGGHVVWWMTASHISVHSALQTDSDNEWHWHSSSAVTSTSDYKLYMITMKYQSQQDNIVCRLVGYSIVWRQMVTEWHWTGHRPAIVAIISKSDCLCQLSHRPKAVCDTTTQQL